MGLDFGTLVRAALGGTANYQAGKRAGTQTKLEREIAEEKRVRDEELRLSNLAENKSQAAAADALAAQRKAQTEHPELFRSAGSTPEHVAKSTYFDQLVSEGKTPAQANEAVRLRFGGTPERAQAPVYGSPEYLKAVDAVEGVRDRHQKTAGRDTGEAGSAKDAQDRREFMQSRITHWIDEGMSSGEAQRRAETEYRGSQYSANAVTKPGTAALLAKTVPVERKGGTSSANAGRSGVKPTETSSTQKADPTSSTSPKAGAIRPATDAEIDAAIDAVGSDPKKIRAWLSKKGLTE